MLPNLIIIGAMKCGTISLHYLRWPIEEFIDYFFAKPIVQPKINDTLRQELKARLRKDISKLREFTGCDLKQWSI